MKKQEIEADILQQEKGIVNDKRFYSSVNNQFIKELKGDLGKKMLQDPTKVKFTNETIFTKIKDWFYLKFKKNN